MLTGKDVRILGKAATFQSDAKQKGEPLMKGIRVLILALVLSVASAPIISAAPEPATLEEYQIEYKKLKKRYISYRKKSKELEAELEAVRGASVETPASDPLTESKSNASAMDVVIITIMLVVIIVLWFKNRKLKKAEKSMIQSLPYEQPEDTSFDYGLYKPTFEFASSLDYKDELTKVRDQEKQMFSNGTAINGNKNWRVNGSLSKGRNMVSDIQKLVARAFNADCDSIISKVTYTNYDKSADRIRKSAEAISRFGKVMDISISSDYLDLKIRELNLAYEYQEKKQQEKEEAREAREALREAAKLQKELEIQRAKIEKEQTHYETALARIERQLIEQPDNAELLAKKAELESHLKEVERNMQDIDYRQANQKAGYVYVISNIGAFGENVYKIGMTRRLDPQDRIDELGGASVPFNFDVHTMIFCDDAPALEAALHRAFEKQKINLVNQRREFFRVSLDEIKKVVRENFDKTVEFVDEPEAEQFRISEKMRAGF